MDYFRILPDKRVSFPLAKPLPLSSIAQRSHKLPKKEFEELPELMVGSYDYTQQTEICDFLYEPVFMMQTMFKDLFEAMEPKCVFKAVQMMPQDSEKKELPMPLYWLPYLDEVECIHDDSEMHPVGLVKTLILKKDKIRGKVVICVKHRIEAIWVLSLAGAESVLRRCPVGIKLERVEVRE